jgi:hypothetical protein
MGLRAFMVRHFGKPVDDGHASFTEADRAVAYSGWVEVGPEFYDPPDTAFSESTIIPPHHDSGRRKQGLKGANDKFHSATVREEGGPDHVL